MHTAEMDKLGELQTKLDALRAHRATLERQKAQLIDTLEGIAARRGPLTRAHAKGDDATVGKRLDDLDFEERSIRRSLEGVEGHLSANAAEIQPLEAEYVAESAAAARRLKEKRFHELLERAEKREKRCETLYRELTGELEMQHNDLVDLNIEYPEHAGGNEASRIYDRMNYRLRLANEGYRISTKTFGNTQALTVLPMLPPGR